MIFDPNPVVSLNNTRLEDNSQIPAAAYSEVFSETCRIQVCLMDHSLAHVQHQTESKERT